MIPKELEARILRYAHSEKWPVGTIANHLHIHHSVITRILEKNGLPRSKRVTGSSILDPYLPFLRQTLEQFPSLTASRLYGMACERGYTGKPSHFRSRIAEMRPEPTSEAYLRLVTLPGEQAQVDWGHFGELRIGNAIRKLMAFVMVLSWSRRIFLQFFPDARMSSFLQGHEAAFTAWNGVPRVLLYDNLKSAVLERHGDAIRFHPTLLEFSGHYRYEPRPVGVRKGNEKGRVERAIRYVRDNFWPARQWHDLADLNQQARAWCDTVAVERPCPQDRSMSVKAAFEQEQPALLALPDSRYPTEEQVEVSVGKTPYVRFDLNDYSVPYTLVRKTLLLRATPVQVRILQGSDVVATHPRSYDKGQCIEDPTHVAALVEHKKAARAHRNQDRLAQMAPQSGELLQQAANRGDNLKTIATTLLQLLDDYGAEELQIAIAEALQRGVPHPNSVRQVLEQRRDDRNEPPPLSLRLPDNPQLQRMTVQPHDLRGYDQIGKQPESDHE